jgi:hypothetical protein
MFRDYMCQWVMHTLPYLFGTYYALVLIHWGYHFESHCYLARRLDIPLTFLLLTACHFWVIALGRLRTSQRRASGRKQREVCDIFHKGQGHSQVLNDQANGETNSSHP